MRRDRLVLGVILVSVFIMPIGISGTAIALPAIGRDLGTDSVPLQWVINGFNASFAIFTVAWGIFADRFGYRRTFVLGALVFLASSALSVTATNLELLDAARALAGAGGAGVVAGGAAILSNAFTGDARRRAFAAFGTMIGLGLALGPTIAGLLVSAAGWRAIYVATGAIVAVGLAGSPALPLVEVPRQKVLDLSLLRNRRFVGFALVPVAAAVGFVTMLSYLPDALGAMFGMSAAKAGLFMLPMTIPVFVGPMLADRLGRMKSWATPPVLMEVALGALFIGDLGLLALQPGRSPFVAVVPMILLGFGFGIPVGLVDGMAIGSVEATRSGTAAGVLNFLRMGSEAVAVGAYGAAVAALLGARLPSAIALRVAAGASGHASSYATSLDEVLLVMAALVAVAFLATWRLLQAPKTPLTVAPIATSSAGAELRPSDCVA